MQSQKSTMDGVTDHNFNQPIHQTAEEPSGTSEPPESQTKRPPMQVVWRNVVWMSLLHIGALYGIWLLPKASYLTWAWTWILYFFSALGITAGAHRLWSHRAYKAKLPLRIFLAIIQTLAFQNHIIEWCRDHRVHHKYSETDADPHNAKRGFFFSHCGWLLVRKHPDVKVKGKLLDLSDLYADPVCVFQKKYYKPLMVFWCFIFPAVIPWYLWGESLWNAYFISSIMRYVINLHVTWNVNSLAHMFGNKPYDRNINPVENILVTLGAIGEGFHNYHHTFPQDYSTSEFGWKFNLTTLFIDAMARIGQVTDRKTMHPDLVKKRMTRTGDGSKGFGFLSNWIKVFQFKIE